MVQPEVAHVGLYQDELTAKGIKFDTYTRELKDVDRAILDGETEGQHQPQGRGKKLNLEAVCMSAWFLC